MLVLVATMQGKPEKRQELEKILHDFVAPTRREEGCIQYNLHRAADDENRFMFYEIWRDRAALDAHLKTPYLSAFLERRLELLEKEPDLAFFGMESSYPG